MNTKVNEASLGFRLFQAAKDLVWQEEPQRNARAAAPAPAAANLPKPVAQNNANPAPTNVTALAPNSNPIAEELLRLIMNRPTAFSALGEAIGALQGISMDEGTRYRSAFAVIAKTQQRTADQIAQAIDVHLSVLESESERFNRQSKQAEQAEITERCKLVADLNAAVDSDKRQIDKLRADTEALIRKIQDEVAHKQARASQLTQEVEQKKQAILQTTQQFESAIGIVKKQLANERAKMEEYLMAD